MKIHAIQTGTVAIKTRQVQGVGHGARRQLNMFLDREWTEPLPIFAFAIEHPEGVIVVDTGESARTAERDYFPSWHPFFRYGLRLWVAPEEEIGPQLNRLGIATSDVRQSSSPTCTPTTPAGCATSPTARSSPRAPTSRSPPAARGRLRGYPNRAAAPLVRSHHASSCRTGRTGRSRRAWR